MTILPDSLEVGRCYLSLTGYVRRITRLMPDERVLFEVRPGHVADVKAWRTGILDRRSFIAITEREVPCDWTPEADE